MMSEFFLPNNLQFRYEPFPIGRMVPMVEEATYRQMTQQWPPKALFEHQPRLGDKYTLSQSCHPREYRDFVRSSPLWSRFDEFITSPQFITETMQALLARHIDLGYREGVSKFKQTMKNLRALATGRSSHRGARLTGSWEFQMMPCVGGHILPHTDAPSKIVTITLAIIGPGEWDTAWGGGLDINRSRDARYAYNQLNRQAAFDDMAVVDTFEFTPNSGVVFIKTFNSWHSVRPMTGKDPNVMRRNIIINIKST
jgi:hypothetical protein